VAAIGETWFFLYTLHPTLCTDYFGLSLALSSPSADIDWRGKEVMRVKYEENRVDEMVLALMHLTTFKESSGYRTWKNHDWEVMDRLHQKGFIGNPKSKVRSVDLTKEGQLRSEELFKKQFS
jgi:hypothetical protein